MSVKPIPDGYHSVTAYLIARDASAAIAYYTKAFGATELFRMAGPDGKLGHAEILVGDSRVMLADEHPEMGAVGPQTLQGTSVGFCLYVNDCDAVFNQAIAAGGTVLRPLADQFYGDRSGTLLDPFGHKWTVATHKERRPTRGNEQPLRSHDGKNGGGWRWLTLAPISRLKLALSENDRRLGLRAGGWITDNSGSSNVPARGSG